MRFFGTLTILFILSACSIMQSSAPQSETPSILKTQDSPDSDKDYSMVEFPTSMPNAYSPQSSDSTKIRSLFMLDSYNLNIMESYPIQISLDLSGSLPTPCHELRIEISQPDQQYQIQIEAYSVLDPEVMCAQVIKPIEITIPMGSFPSGHYSVWINGNLIGNFDS